jgi:hypothetical protein
MVTHTKKIDHYDSGDVENMIDRARLQLSYGLSESDVGQSLVKTNATPDQAWFAIQAAKILMKDQ